MLSMFLTFTVEHRSGINAVLSVNNEIITICIVLADFIAIDINKHNVPIGNSILCTNDLYHFSLAVAFEPHFS